MEFAFLAIFICTALAGNTLFFVKGQCNSVELVTRDGWNARPPRQVTPLHTPVNMTFVHHTAGTWNCTDKATCILMVQDIQNLHMDTNGWDDIGYNFLVGEDGRVYEGRGWQNRGAHSPVYNDISHGTCVIGNYMERAPNEKALNATQAWIRCGLDSGYILPAYELFGHRDGRCTECPGDVLFGIIQTWPHYSFRDIPIICRKPDDGAKSGAAPGTAHPGSWAVISLFCALVVLTAKSLRL